MARPRRLTPSYRLHRPSKTAYSDYTDPLTGRRRSVCLGPWNSTASKAAHASLCRQLAEGGPPPSTDLSVSELLLRYWKFAEGYYVKDGRQTDEIACLKSAIRPLRELFGLGMAMLFGPLELRAVQNRMVADGMSRKTVNKNVGRIRRVFRWAVAEGILDPGVITGLEAVAPLKKGRCAARERPGVRPVDDEVVEATLPHLSAVVVAMVKLQRLTGMRPDEVCRVRGRDLDRTADVWLYTPDRHKTEHHGRQRVIPIGPKAQAVLSPFLFRDPEAYCFSPKAAVAELRVKQQGERAGRDGGSGGNRKRRACDPSRPAGTKYTSDSYRVAVGRACDRAFPPPAPLDRRPDETEAGWWERLTDEQKREVEVWQKAHRWHPNQLRHSAGTEVRRRFGLEVSRTVLGHSDSGTTEIYAERDVAAAVEAARQIG